MLTEKKCIFITSVGRSGTRFIAKTFPTMIANSRSFHEPDILTTKHIEEWPLKFRNFGFINITVGKFLGVSGLRFKPDVCETSDLLGIDLVTMWGYHRI